MSDRLLSESLAESVPTGYLNMHAPTLLIVEDEERMRRLLELVLKPAGYELTLRQFRNRCHQFDPGSNVVQISS